MLILDDVELNVIVLSSTINSFGKQRIVCILLIDLVSCIHEEPKRFQLEMFSLVKSSCCFIVWFGFSCEK